MRSEAESRKRILEWRRELEGVGPEGVLAWARKKFGDRVVLASSLGEEDQVLTQMASGSAPGMTVFTLDTGRLFPETYELLERTRRRYSNLKFRVLFHDAGRVE